ncbi:MAG: hypothetical protein ACYC56_03605 [Candidatus Aquicultor sp.]
MVQQVIETGDLYFFYRPKNHKEVIRNLDEVESFYMVMAAGGHLFRLLETVQKKMPEIPSESSAPAGSSWAVIDSVTEDSDELAETKLGWGPVIKGKTSYPARPIGVAKYQLVLFENQTRLAYSLEIPINPGPVQETFDIYPEAAYIFKVKNPDGLAEGYPGEEQRPLYPPGLKVLFDEDLINVKDDQLLNFPHTQILLSGSLRQDIENRLGIKFVKEPPHKAMDRVYGTFHMTRREHPATPFMSGQWLRGKEAA